MSDEKKLHIDEDWKSQVAREKEQFAKKSTSPAPASSTAMDSSIIHEASNDDTSGVESKRTTNSNCRLVQVHPKRNHPNPRPTRNRAGRCGAVSTTQLERIGYHACDSSHGFAWAVPNPRQQIFETDLTLAKHFIDLLGVIEEKTKTI